MEKSFFFFSKGDGKCVFFFFYGEGVGVGRDRVKRAGHEKWGILVIIFVWFLGIRKERSRWGKMIFFLYFGKGAGGCSQIRKDIVINFYLIFRNRSEKVLWILMEVCFFFFSLLRVGGGGGGGRGMGRERRMCHEKWGILVIIFRLTSRGMKKRCRGWGKGFFFLIRRVGFGLEFVKGYYLQVFFFG